MKINFFLNDLKTFLFLRVKLTRDVMNINFLVIQIVNEINELRISQQDDSTIQTEESSSKETKASASSSSVTALVYVILEICIRDLIKYVPNLLVSSSETMNRTKTCFIHMNISTCKQMNSRDVELIKCVLQVLTSLPFQKNIPTESKLFLILI